MANRTRNWVAWIGLVSIQFAASASAQAPIEIESKPIAALNSPIQVSGEEMPLKDLTPSGFADLIPPPAHEGHTYVPGHLSPIVPNKSGFFAQADYLLMRPRADGLDYAVRNRTDGLATSGPIQMLRYGWANGFRTELGYRSEETGLEGSFAYTNLRGTGGSVAGIETGQVLFPTRTRPGLTDSVTSASAASVLNYNLYDALIGRRYAFDEHFALRTFAGIRFADIRQSFAANYNGLDARNAEVISRSQFLGAGPLIGAEGVFAWQRGLHLYVRGSAGLVSGLSNSSHFEFNDDGRTLYADLPSDTRKVVPMVALGIGGGWQYRTVSLRFGYEVTHWFGVQDRIRLTSDVAQGALIPQSGNLSLDGLFIQFGIAF